MTCSGLFEMFRKTQEYLDRMKEKQEDEKK